jgi:murein DD-endopeptidase MepM/ murein hydrolase activator NlpD
MPMNRLRRWLKKIHTPVTIMVIPHSRFSSRSIKTPFILIALVCILSTMGVAYTISLTAHAVEYFRLKREYASMNKEFKEMASTMTALKESETRFRQLFALGSKKEVLVNYTPDESGSIDLDVLKAQVNSSMDSVKEIKAYLAKQRDRFMSTPQGWPADGRITSGFGMRIHPITGERKLHTGDDISVSRGTPLHATADGIVSFADRNAGNGNIVVIEHGYGYSTVYAHDSKILVHAGEKVKRGEVVALSGSTGTSTGPHVHYEVWKNGKSVDPEPYLRGRIAN